MAYEVAVLTLVTSASTRTVPAETSEAATDLGAAGVLYTVPAVT